VRHHGFSSSSLYKVTPEQAPRNLLIDLDVYWIVHNFVRVHFTTRQVPAVALGVLEECFSLQEIFLIQKAA